MRSADTDREAERVQIQLLRDATPAQRVALAVSLTRLTMQLTWRAIVRANQTADEDELRVLFVKHCYGPELAEGFRQDLAARRARRDPP